MKIRKISLIKIAAISFLLSIFWSASAYAQPTITGFSGSLSNGSIITINGNSFGVNGPNIIIFDDFESGTNGANIKIGAGSATIGEWTSVTYLYPTPPKYSNAHSLSGSLAFRGDATKTIPSDLNGSGTTAFKCLNNVCGVSGPTTSDIFVSYWYYFPTTSDWPCLSGTNCNNKLVWVTGSGTSDDDRVIPATSGGDKNTIYNLYMFGNDSIGEPPLSPSLIMSKGKWYRFWAYLHGAGNTTDHEELWVASPSSEANIAAATRINRTTQIWNTTYNGFNRVMINGFNRWCNDCAESAPTFDDVYVSIGIGARARVEIGDAATYATSKNLTIATVTSWGDTSITATIRQGSFSNLNNAYLYVIDADGNVNTNGYLLSDGSGNTPPSSSGSGGDSSASGGGGCGFVKDNGKGQGAKGEGLAFAMMLIIILGGIGLRKITAELKMRSVFSLLKNSFYFFVFAILFALITACGSGGSSDSSNSSNSSGGGTNNGAATITMVLPQNNSVGAALDTYITLQSSAPLNPGTVSASTFYVRGQGNSAVTATVSYQNQAVTIRPQSALQPLTTYSVVCANGVKDANGLDVPGRTWSFTTTNAAGNPLPLMGLWESQMVTAGNKWGLFLQSPNNSFDAKLDAVYYDSERTFYQISTYLGQAEPWNSYAQAAETVFRDSYFIPNTYHIPGYYRFPDGLYLDWLRNGDTTSAAGLVLMRDNPAYSDPDTSPFAYAWYWHRFSREIAYAIGANVLAERAGNPRQTARMQLYIPMALNHLLEWRTQQFGDPDVSQHFFQPFMFGLTADALITYYEWEVEQGHNPDETIPNAIKATVDWMWTAPVVDQQGKVMWIPDLGGTGGAYTDTGGLGFGGFRYADRTYTVSGGGGPAPAPDLNLLIAPAYAWLYKHFGDPAYRDKGDLVWKGGVAPASADWSGKLFNQQYRLSFNYVKWRQEGLAKWGN